MVMKSSEAARFMGISVAQLIKMVDAGLIPFTRMATRGTKRGQMLFNLDDLKSARNQLPVTCRRLIKQEAADRISSIRAECKARIEAIMAEEVARIAKLKEDL